MTDVLNLQIPSPTFGGSTGGWLRAAETEEKYAITWTSKKEQVFEIKTILRISGYGLNPYFAAPTTAAAASAAPASEE